MTRSGIFSEENRVFEIVMGKADPVSKPHAINDHWYHVNCPLLYVSKHLVQWRCNSHKSHPHHHMQLRGPLQYSAALPPRKKGGTHFVGSFVGPRAGLDRSGESRQHSDSISAPSSPWRVAIRSDVSRPIFVKLLIMTSRVMKLRTCSSSITSVSDTGNALNWYSGYARFESRWGCYSHWFFLVLLSHRIQTLT